MALLWAYFDESGTHGGAAATAISGFVGEADGWLSVRSRWLAATKGKVFHHKRHAADDPLVETLCGIIEKSSLWGVTGGFSGKWRHAISSGAPDWRKRFPSAYNYCFELCIEQMDRLAKTHWGDQPISLVFSSQSAYADRAKEVWRTQKGNGYWQRFTAFIYSTPEEQAADLIAHQIYQTLDKDLATWMKWLLMKGIYEKRVKALGGYQDEKSLKAMMDKADKDGRIYLKTVPAT